LCIKVPTYSYSRLCCCYSLSFSPHSIFSLSVSVFSKTNQNVQSKQTIYSFVIRGSNFMTFVNLVKHTRAIICIFPTFEFVFVLVLVLLYCESKFLSMLYNKTSINCCFVGFQGQQYSYVYISTVLNVHATHSNTALLLPIRMFSEQNNGSFRCI